MKRSELHEPYRSIPEHQEIDVPIEYSVPYAWGDLYVSKTAHDAYGLVPLITNVKDGYSEQDLSDVIPRTRIFLLTAGELGTPPVEQGAAYISPTLNRDGLECRITIGANKNTTPELLSGIIHDMISQATGEDYEVVTDSITGNNIPISERFKNDFSQILIHELCDTLSTHISEATKVWVRAESNYQFYGRAKRIGAIAILGVGALTVPPILTHDFDAVNAGFAGAWLAWQASSMRHLLKGRLVTSNQQEFIFQAVSKNSATQITSDIHDTYCRNHFNQQLEGQFLPDE
jgi:hypothetical protein